MFKHRKKLQISAKTISGGVSSSYGNEIVGGAFAQNAVEDDCGQRKGMSYFLTSFFLVAQLAGAGFLAIPKAFSMCGWIGLPLLVLFCLSVAFSGTRLGHCWVILEERWPEYQMPVRQPYMEIAFRSFGVIGKRIVLVAVLVTLLGTTIIYLILISQFLHSFIPQLSICMWTTIIAFCFLPFTWIGTPKDLWQASVVAVIATAFACAVIFVQLVLDMNSDYVPDSPTYYNPTIFSFALGFGTISAAFGGASAFPTFQNDMKDRTQFWKSVSIGFVVLLIMYVPVAVAGFAILGNDVPSNILLYRGSDLSLTVQVAIGFEIINLLGSYLITFNPVGLILEELCNVPPKFGWQRCALRTGIILFNLMVALAIPDFGLILNLVGGSSITICSFIMPPIMYMKLVSDHSNEKWPKRKIPMWEKLFLLEIVGVGCVGGIISTGTAFYAILNSSFGSSCFADYYQAG